MEPTKTLWFAQALEKFGNPTLKTFHFAARTVFLSSLSLLLVFTFPPLSNSAFGRVQTVQTLYGPSFLPPLLYNLTAELPLQLTYDLLGAMQVLTLTSNMLGWRRAFPHVEEFIKQKAVSYPRLTVVDRMGAPRLTLHSGDEREVVLIEGWKTEHIEEFLTERLLDSAEPDRGLPGEPQGGQTLGAASK